MRSKGQFLGCLFLLLSIGCSREQIDIDKEELFERHLAALGNGNKDVVLKILARTEIYTSYIDDKKVGILENVIEGPTRIYQKLVTGDTEIIKLLQDERTGWQESKDEVRDLKRREILALRLAASYSDFLGYQQAGRAFEIKGITDVNGQPCYVLAVRTPRGSFISDIFISKDSFLVLKRESEIRNGKLEVFYSDFQPFKGVNIPHTLLVMGPHGDVIFKLDSIEAETGDAGELIGR